MPDLFAHYHATHSVADTAAQLGLAPSEVLAELRAAGVEVRGRPRRQRGLALGDMRVWGRAAAAPAPQLGRGCA
jgi:hypothetical protein